MNEKENILTELKSISAILAGISNSNVYKVPDNYFNEIGDAIAAKIIADTFAPAINNMQVPLGYFENLPASILQKIKATEHIETTVQEMNALSPLVASIGNHNIYQVPHGYFETLSFKNNAAPKVIKLFATKNIVKYAAAAMLAALVTIGTVKYASNTNTPKLDATAEAVIKQADEILKKGTFDSELNSISDKDLENYLSQNGEDVNAALVASTINDNDALPNEDEYLMDDKTLDNFMSENNLKN